MRKIIVKFSLLVLAIIFLQFTFGCGKADNSPPLKSTSFSLKENHFSIQVPFDLKQEPSVIPATLRPFVDADINMSGGDDKFGIHVQGFLYDKSKLPAGQKPDLEGAAKGSLFFASMASGVSNFESSKTNKSVSGKPAIVATAKFDDGDKKREMRALYVIDDYALWIAIIQFDQSDDARRTLADQIIVSAKLEQ